MAENKTILNDADVNVFINSITDDLKKEDAKKMLQIMKKITGKKPQMWGGSIVGFGSYHYKYASGREGDMPLTGFSPRKQNFTMYIMSGFSKESALMKKLGKYKTGKSCLYVKKLDDIDVDILKELISRSITHVKAMEIKMNAK